MCDFSTIRREDIVPLNASCYPCNNLSLETLKHVAGKGLDRSGIFIGTSYGWIGKGLDFCSHERFHRHILCYSTFHRHTRLLSHQQREGHWEAKMSAHHMKSYTPQAPNSSKWSQSWMSSPLPKVWLFVSHPGVWFPYQGTDEITAGFHHELGIDRCLHL